MSILSQIDRLKENKAMAVQIRERLCASLQKCSNRSHWKALSFAITHYGNALHFSVQATVSPLLKSEKEQTPPAISPSIQEQQEEVRSLSIIKGI